MSENNNILPHVPTADELEAQRKGQDFLKGDEWQDVNVEPYRLNFQDAYEKPMFTLSWNGIPFAPLGGIHAITGQAGNGKTMTIAQFMAAILNGEFGSLRYELSEQVPEPRVLYIDTEMEKANTIAVKNRVMTMCGRDIATNYDDFVVVMLREVPEQVISTEKGKTVRIPSSVMRWRMVLKAIWQYKPTCVFIDGLLDVVADFNDNKECQDIIYKCMQVASHYGISVWSIVHQNPGGEKLVGHLGSFLERKVTDIIMTSKTKDKETGDATFTVSQKKTRGRDIADWTFKILPVNGWGMPEQQEETDERMDKIDPNMVKMLLEQNQSEVDWPATQTDIRNKIFRAKGCIKNNDELQKCMTIARNMRFIIPQPREEYKERQLKPMYYLNGEVLNVLEF